MIFKPGDYIISSYTGAVLLLKDDEAVCIGTGNGGVFKWELGRKIKYSSSHDWPEQWSLYNKSIKYQSLYSKLQ